MYIKSDPVEFLSGTRNSFSKVKKDMDKDAYLLITLGLVHQLLRVNPPTNNQPASTTSSSSSSASYANEQSVEITGRDLAEQLLKEVEPELENRTGNVDPLHQLALEAPVEEPVVASYHLCLAEKALVCLIKFLKFFIYLFIFNYF